MNITVLKPPAVPAEAVDADAVVIGELYTRASGCIVESVKYQIECGNKLVLKKAELHDTLGHGSWLPWLRANASTLGFDTRRTASRLMKIASNGTLASHLDSMTAEKATLVSRQTWGHEEDEADEPKLIRGTQGTGENEWFTPNEFLEAAHKVLGEFDLDPASNEQAQRAVRAKKFFTKDDDGLTKEWHGNIWLNPPYAQPFIADFANKMVEEIELGHVKQAIMLTHNYTDTAWFHTLEQKATAICWTRGRIRFIGPNGEIAACTQGQVFFYFGNAWQKFYKVFAAIGFVRPHMDLILKG